MGKTGLIEHCFHQKEIAQGYYTFFVDIYATGSLKELVFMLGKHIFDTLKPKGRKFVEGFFAAIGSLRPAFKLDAVSGEPVFDIGIGEIRKPEVSLEELFAYLEAADKPCLVAIDEFQQIMEYPEKGVEGLLRSYIQFLPNVHFIFSGSKKHLMEYIFFSIKRPFYQSTPKLFLDKISKEVYFSFAHSFFEKEGKELPEEIFDKVYTWVDGHTWYVQYLLNRLFALPEKTLSPELLDSLMMEILQEEEYTYQTYFQLLTFNQTQLLKAIAKEGIVREVNAAAFIKKYDLKAVSNVNTSLRILIDKEFILRQPDGYIVYDRFMSIWLSRI